MGKSIHVLLVDDDEDDKLLFTEALFLISNAIQCTYFASGIDAIKWLTTTPGLPHYIFLDLNMPRMNGLEVLKEIKKHPPVQHLPVIIYSTSGGETYRRQATELGATLYLTKPYKLSDIKKEIARVFEIIKPGE